MGYDEALEFWREKRDFEAVFVLKDNRVVVTEGIAESFSQRNESGRYTYEAAKR
jgi:thiamine biosynthesis lipoprotein